MSNETPARILKVTVESDGEDRAIKVSPDAAPPRRVIIDFEGGKKVEVNADGGFSFTASDGRTVTVNADGEVGASARLSPGVSEMGPVNVSGSRGVQIGPGGFQANVF